MWIRELKWPQIEHGEEVDAPSVGRGTKRGNWRKEERERRERR